jgi:nucleotide-binding universal stress UspA family protein
VIHPIADKTTLNYHVHSIIAALDGSRYSEKILPYAAQLAQVLKLNLELIQAIPGGREIPPEIKQDVLEDAYLAPRAHHLEKEFGVRVKWDVLHGPPAKAICSYVSGRKDALLAMTSHARRPVEHALLGSVTSACVRGAEIPLLIEGFNERESLYEAAI